MAMLNSALHSDALDFVGQDRSTTQASSLAARLVGLLDAVDRKVQGLARSRRESKVAKFLADNGGHVTDELEREMSRRFGGIVGG